MSPLFINSSPASPPKAKQSTSQLPFQASHSLRVTSPSSPSSLHYKQQLGSRSKKMGFVLVISLPFIFLSILLGFGCYFLGKHKGREEMRTGVGAQVYGTPLPPPGVAGGPKPAPGPYPMKKEGPDNV